MNAEPCFGILCHAWNFECEDRYLHLHFNMLASSYFPPRFISKCSFFVPLPNCATFNHVPVFLNIDVWSVFVIASHLELRAFKHLPLLVGIILIPPSSFSIVVFFFALGLSSLSWHFNRSCRMLKFLLSPGLGN